jgi:phosphocarrier protein HPr
MPPWEDRVEQSRAGSQVKDAKDRGGEPASDLHFAEVVIRNKKGLHARASAQFVRCASGFNARARVTREGHTVGGTSIMGLMMLAAGQGQSILIETEGTDARPALDALIALVESGFGEED